MNHTIVKKNYDRNYHSSSLNHSGLGMLVVIDRNVDDISTLVNGVLAGAKVLVLDSETDSIEQITRALAEDKFNSLHLVSHGAPGVLYLGHNPLTLDNLNRYSYQLQEWGVPEILLYSCNVAAGEVGSELIERLHQLTGANIAASATKTGNSALGGDWNLEIQTNQQPVNLAFSESAMAQYSFTLNNTGTGNFSDSGQNLGNSGSTRVDLGDVDGDGDLDAFITNQNQANKVWLNDGSGNFTDSGQSLGSFNSISLELGDVDGDGDLDAFVGNFTQGNKVWLNDGSGNFSDSGQNLGSFNSVGVNLGDLDGDGDLDAFIANQNQANKVWLNDGSGNFTDNGQSLGSFNSVGVNLGDLDGDGDLDAFVANYSGQANKVWLNNGSGNFSDSGQNLGSFWSRGVNLGDVDEDGDLDAFVANFNNQPNKVWLNNGSGNFSDSGQNLGNSTSIGVNLGDVDGDGDLDTFVGNFNNQPNKVWLNNGSGNFTDSGQNLGSSTSYNVTLGDVDGNGSLDAFVGNYGQPNKVFLNEATIINIEGTSEDDYIEGTAADEIITGIGGSDFLIGHGGNDLIEGGDGVDLIEAGAGNDIIDGGADDDLMFGDAGHDRMIGSSGIDFFLGGAGEDTADYSNIGEAITFDSQTIVNKGSAGIDEIFEVETIIGALNLANKIDGSTGVNDANSFEVDLTADSLIVDDGVAPITYTVENFVDVTGTPNDDSVTGNDADNTILGRAGNDLFIGSLGNDTFNGGGGQDTADYALLDAAITFDAQTQVDKAANGIDQVSFVETIIGALGQVNTIDGSTGVNDTNSFDIDLTADSLTVDDGVELTTYTIENFVDVTGTPNDDSVAGNDADNTFLGMAGDDLFIGSLGNDTFNGGAGQDTADYALLDAAITFDAQTEVDKGTNGLDQVLSVETIIGALGQANTIDGSTAVNDGNSFSIDLATNSLIVDDGVEPKTYTVVNFVNASGGSQDDELIGNDEDNLLIGYAGSDSLYGEAGADTLIGVDPNSATPGAGERDHMWGGADADTFVLGDAAQVYYLDDNDPFGRVSQAIIHDFESGVDKIELSGVADDYVTKGSFIYADLGSVDGALDPGDDLIAYAKGGFDAATDFVYA